MNNNIYFSKSDGYRLGHMDLYPIAVLHTPLENCSFFQGYFKQNIDVDKLKVAVRNAVLYFPLFDTELQYRGEYYLRKNNRDISKVVKNTEISDRPKVFGTLDTTNRYLFQICYIRNEISFEWCHCVSDGRGALDFFSKILDAYFNKDLGDIPYEFPLGLPYESIYDSNVEEIGQIKPEKGFGASSLPLIKNGYKCRCTTVKIPTKDVLCLSKRSDATPAAIIVPLLCKAIRNTIPIDVKNKNVSCGIIVDGRKILDFPTMHNCVFNKVITYTNKMDKYDIATQGTIYRSILDLFTQKENLIGYATNMIDSVDILYKMKPRILKKAIMKLIAPIVKNTMNNIAFTYLGRLPFNEEVKNELIDFRFRSWPDIGACVCAASDLNGTLILDITDNYKDYSFLNNFIQLCKANNIDAKVEEVITFEQANFRI